MNNHQRAKSAAHALAHSRAYNYAQTGQSEGEATTDLAVDLCHLARINHGTDLDAFLARIRLHVESELPTAPARVHPEVLGSLRWSRSQ